MTIISSSKYGQILPNLLMLSTYKCVSHRLLWDAATSGGATREAITNNK